MQQTAGTQRRKKIFFRLRGKGEKIVNGGKETYKRVNYRTEDERYNED